MKIAGLLFITLIIGCGEEEKPRAPIYQEEPRCLSCNVVPPSEDFVIPEPQPRMDLMPSELGFYYTLDTYYLYPKQYAYLTNMTEIDVDVLSAKIESVDTYAFGNDGGDYFVLSEMPLPITLAPNEIIIFEISFKFTTDIKIAQFIIETSFQNPYELVTELSGMVFQISSQ
jgi:hypothetical protein